MANKMLSNIQSLTSGVSTLTQKVNELYAAVEKVSEVASSATSGVQGVLKNGGGYHHLNAASNRPGTGADGARFAAGGVMPSYQSMEQSMGTFGGASVSEARNSSANMATTLATANMARMGGVSAGRVGGAMIAAGFGQAAFGLAAGAYAATPDLNMTLTRSLGYYQAGLKMPGISRGQLERATFGAMSGGLSSVGSDALVAAIMAGRGVTPGGTDYLRLSREVGGAYKYLGMENAPAAQALAGLRGGPMAANLYQYGITLRNNKGEMRSTADIAKQLMGVMTGGRGFSSVQAFNESLLRGNLGANMATMGFSEAQQEILIQSMRDQVSGRSGDLATAKPIGDNANTMLTAQGRLNASQTELMMRGESSIIKGFENAADTVEAFNSALLNVIEPLGYLKGLLAGVGGTNVGQGVAAASPGVLGGIGNFLKGSKNVIGAGLMMVPHPVAKVAGMGLIAAGGGGNPGFGAGFNTGMGARGGGNMTAAYGTKDNSGIWSSTNGVHKGMDFAMPIGSPVVATLGGVVSSIDAGADYGTSVVIDHGGGLQTVYGHLSQREVKVGDKVGTGQKIGKSGDTGNTTGPHLHFEVRQGKNNPVDPSVMPALGGLNPTEVYGANGGQGLSYLFASVATGQVDTSKTSEGSYKGSTGTGSQKEWASKLLSSLGAPVSDTNVSALLTWSRFEGGHWKNSAAYNPLNTTLDRPGASSMNSVGVKRYASWEQGIDATVSTLLGNRSKERGYADIVNALRSDSGVSAVLSAVNQSAWVHGEGKPSNYNFPRGGGATGYGASFATEREASGARNVYINVKYDKADQTAALKLAKMVESYLKDNAANSSIGGS
jgi:murein DD-endopeptidase MepM/ murein hydrolase activator NlpD